MVICVALFAYRARRVPPLLPLYTVGVAVALLWAAPQQSSGFLAGLYLFGAGYGAFLAGALAISELNWIEKEIIARRNNQ